MRNYFIKKIVLVLFIGISGSAFCQNSDSLHFKNAQWQQTKISSKLQLYTAHFTGDKLFDTLENISYVKVRRGWCSPKFKLGASPKKLITVSKFADSVGAAAAINGNFFDTKNGGSVDFIKVNGKVINTSRGENTGKRDFHQQAAIIIKNGRPMVIKWDGRTDWERNIKGKNIMLNGPLLIYNHQPETLDNSAFTTKRHPRSAFGIISRREYIMLVADGRSPNAAGMNLHELTKVMQWLHCKDAVNFDGGGSSTLFVKGRGVVNYPSDNKKWDHEGERGVANILYVK